MYQRIIPILQRATIDVGLRERLRCRFLLEEHERRPDFPPDLVLRDQNGTDVLLRDHNPAFGVWRMRFGEEITVTPVDPGLSTVYTGLNLSGGWVVKMVGGQIIQELDPNPALAFPALTLSQFQTQFSLEVIGGELVYEQFGGTVPGEALGSTSWALRFGQEITVEPWPFPTPINGMALNAGWWLKMLDGEIVIQQNPPPVPITQFFTRADLFVDENGEVIYTPRITAS